MIYFSENYKLDFRKWLSSPGAKSARDQSLWSLLCISSRQLTGCEEICINRKLEGLRISYKSLFTFKKNRGICFSLPLPPDFTAGVRKEANLQMLHALPELCPGTKQALGVQNKSKSSISKQTLNLPPRPSSRAWILYFLLP